jgi:hypothetical protein
MAVKYYDAQATGANDGSSAANAWTDLQTAFSGISAGDTLYLKKQPSRIGSNGTNANMTVNIASSAGLQTQIIGYGSTIGDGVRFETSDGITVSTDFVFMANIDLLITDNKPRSLSFESDGGVIYNCVQDVAYLYGGGMSVMESWLEREAEVLLVLLLRSVIETAELKAALLLIREPVRTTAVLESA